MQKIMKVRQCFIFDRQYFMVETFLNIENNPSILRVESTTTGNKTKLPPFLKIIKEVTNDDMYETWFMARSGYQMPEEDVLAIQESLLEEKQQEPALLMAKINSTKNRPGSAMQRKNNIRQEAAGPVGQAAASAPATATPTTSTVEDGRM